jgi:hypothetical protein
VAKWLQTRIVGSSNNFLDMTLVLRLHIGAARMFVGGREALAYCQAR